MTILTYVLVLLGIFFVLVAAIGVLRMPDLLTRMHAATKAGTLGAGLLLLAVALAYHDAGVTVRALSIIAFLFLTAPIAAHVIGRAAYLTNSVSLWEGTVMDELKDRQPTRPAPPETPAAPALPNSLPNNNPP